MAHIILITGGQRSGKSNYAKKIVLDLDAFPIYLATSRTWDDDHKERIIRHRKDRGKQWKTIEEEKHISKHNWEGKTVLMDCVTLWLTNFFFDNNQDIDKCLELAKNELTAISQQNTTFVIVSNELGMGGHPASNIQMKFNDLQGWTNQFIAEMANEVYLMVSGIPVKIKQA